MTFQLMDYANSQQQEPPGITVTIHNLRPASGEFASSSQAAARQAVATLGLSPDSVTNSRMEQRKTTAQGLPNVLSELDIQELHASNGFLAVHHETLLALVRSPSKPRWATLGGVAFDLEDVLDVQLAQLMLVLAGHEPAPVPPVPQRSVTRHAPRSASNSARRRPKSDSS